MNCIAETLATLRAKRDELSAIIVWLERMFGAELGTVTGLKTYEDIRMENGIPLESGTIQAKPATKAPKSDTLTPSRATKRINVSGARIRNGQAVIEACRQLNEPFTAEQLKVASGLSKKGASSTVYRWLDRDWLNKDAPGLFSRTATFGGEPNVTARSRQMLEEIHKEEAAKLQKEDWT